MHDIEAEKQILTKSACCYHLFQVPMSGSDKPYIGSTRPLGPQGLVFAIFQYPQQFDLQGQGQIANLVEK